MAKPTQHCSITSNFLCIFAGPLPSNHGIPSVAAGPPIGSLVKFTAQLDDGTTVPGAGLELRIPELDPGLEFKVGTLYGLDFTEKVPDPPPDPAP